jgi:hypothetical protein
MRSVLDQLSELRIEPGGAESEPTSTSSSELLEPVKRRADQIRAGWRSPVGPAGITVEQEPPAFPDRVTGIVNGNRTEQFSAPTTTVSNDASTATQHDLPSDPDEREMPEDDEDETEPVGGRGSGLLLTAALTSEQVRAAIYGAPQTSGAIYQEMLIRSSAAQLGSRG